MHFLFNLRLFVKWSGMDGSAVQDKDRPSLLPQAWTPELEK